MGNRKKNENKNPNMSSGMSSTQTRVRKYSLNYRGEIVVLIRAKEKEDSLQSRKLFKHIFESFKYTSKVTQVNQHKIKVEFHEREKDNNKNTNDVIKREAGISIDDDERTQAIKEANILVKRGLEHCHVYIPAKYSEVQGVISWPIGEDTTDFLPSSKGIFNNSMINEVELIDIVRLKKKSSEASNVQQLENTSIVIVTFEGVLLPDKLKYDRMIIPVREYRRREMFCVNCKRYGHTQKFCNNKKSKIQHTCACNAMSMITSEEAHNVLEEKF